jgi:hypothetical protein
MDAIDVQPSYCLLVTNEKRILYLVVPSFQSQKITTGYRLAACRLRFAACNLQIAKVQGQGSRVKIQDTKRLKFKLGINI